MNKIPFLFLLLMACTSYQANTSSLDSLESKYGIALDQEEIQMIAKKNPSTLQKIQTSADLQINDIVALSEVGISDQFILDYIAYTKKQYILTSNDVKRLERSGVSQRIIHILLKSFD